MPESFSSYSALQEKNFRNFTIGSLIASIGRQMLTVGVGWDIYERTGSALALGLIGLAQLLPVIMLTLPAGHVVDQYSRRHVLIGSQILNAVATAGLVAIAWTQGPVEAMYGCLALAGIARAFSSPANAALLPQIVSPRNFTNAVTWSSMTFQLACILGPALGGLMIGLSHSAAPVYIFDFFSSLVFWLVLLTVESKPQQRIAAKMADIRSLLSGVTFIRNTPIILAAITLDMFAVLFGGAIALLPVYAKDILHVGASGLGWLQAAPSLGALLMGFFLARVPVLRHSGKLLLWTIVGFGLATIVFGLSQNFWLSLGMLFLTGAFDNVSVIIRQALAQLRTPDEMRGRVSAINFLFIGSSNELGGFESGVVAHFFGPVFSVVFGGAATIATVLATGWIWPQLRRLDTLTEDEPAPQST